MWTAPGIARTCSTPASIAAMTPTSWPPSSFRSTLLIKRPLFRRMGRPYAPRALPPGAFPISRAAVAAGAGLVREPSQASPWPTG
jgi:hypothetical protein